MRSILKCAAAALFILHVQAANAGKAAIDDCRDDRGVNRCAPEQHRKVLELFDLDPIDRHRDRGDQVRRVFYVDGYGRDLMAISFIRAPGHDPAVFVHYPRENGEPETKPLHGQVPHAVWEDILTRSAFFDRALAPLPGKADELSLCLHSWVYTVEASDPAGPNLDKALLRRKTANACNKGPATAYAGEVRRAAVKIFPHCDRLDPEQHRGGFTQLFECRRLRGDRLAAAEVMNQAVAFKAFVDAEDKGRLVQSFAADAVVDWNGERGPSQQLQAAAFWSSKIAQAAGPRAGESAFPNQVFFSVEHVEGLSADRVRLVGHLHRSRQGANGVAAVDERARVEQLWVFGSAREFQVERATVGPWQLHRH